MALIDKLNAIGNAIRSKNGTTQKLTLDAMPDAILNISTDSGATLNSNEQLLLNVTAYANGVKYTGTIPTINGKTVTPSETVQTIVNAKTYVAGDIKVSAISNTYIGSAVTRKTAQTYTPTESQQTIASGQYLSGTQTISAIPSNYIGSAVVIQNYYTGSTVPASSLGQNGDLYLKV